MPERGRHRRGRGRVGYLGTRPLSFDGNRTRRVTGPRLPTALVAEVHRALRTGEPLALLVLVSGLVDALERGDGPNHRHQLDRFHLDGRLAPSPAGPTVHALVRACVESDGPETTALLAVIAQLTDDELGRERARRELNLRAGRLQRLPEWVRWLGDSAATVGAEVVSALGDDEDVLLAVRVPPRHDLSVVVHVDRNLGTVVEDAAVVPERIESLIRLMGRDPDDGTDTTWRALSIANAGARVADAVAAWEASDPPVETETWPACLPLVRWVLRRVPGGGTGYERSQWTDTDRAELAHRFLDSPFGRRHRTPAHEDLLDAILWFGTDHGPGDPLRWTPAAVEILLTDWLPRTGLAPADGLDAAPEVLRDVVWFSHAQRGIRPALTDQTLAVVDACEAGYRTGLRSRHAVPAEPEWASDAGASREAVLDALAEEVGGRDGLAALDDTPLPDEEVGWERVADRISPRVREVAVLCDWWCDVASGPLATEYRTACHRFLTEVAAAAPAVFRRRARVESAAAAVCWAVGHANRLFHAGRGGLRVKDLAAHFGLSGTPSARGATFLEAARFGVARGGRPVLGARYLVSAYRRSLVRHRDRWLASEP